MNTEKTVKQDVTKLQNDITALSAQVSVLKEQQMAEKDKDLHSDQPTKPSPQLEAISSAMRTLVVRVQELDPGFGAISQDLQSISDKIPLLDELPSYRRRIKHLKEDVGRITDNWQVVDHLEQCVHEFATHLDQVHEQLRSIHQIPQPGMVGTLATSSNSKSAIRAPAPESTGTLPPNRVSAHAVVPPLALPVPMDGFSDDESSFQAKTRPTPLLNQQIRESELIRGMSRTSTPGICHTLQIRLVAPMVQPCDTSPPDVQQHHHSRIRDSRNLHGTYGTLSGMFHAHLQNFPNNTLGETTGVPAHGARANAA